MTVAVRAADQFPASGSVRRLNNSPYWWALMYAAAVAHRSSPELSDKFVKHVLRAVKTRFVIAPNDDDEDKKKWLLPEAQGVLADNTVLYGLVLCESVVKTKQRLEMASASAEKMHAATVASWYKGMPAREEAITKSVVERYLRVHGRFEAAPDAKHALILANSEYGKKHTLTATTTLDIARALARARTSVVSVESAALVCDSILCLVGG